MSVFLNEVDPLNADELLDNYGSKRVVEKAQMVSRKHAVENLRGGPRDQKASSMDFGLLSKMNRCRSESDTETRHAYPKRINQGYISDSAVYPRNQCRNKGRGTDRRSFGGSQSFRRNGSLARLHSHISLHVDDSGPQQPVKSTLFNYNRTQNLTLLSLALMNFMVCTSLSVLAPFFPDEASKKGMRPSVQGFVFSIHALTVFITSPIFGKILPTVGAKFLFISGSFVCGVCNVLFGMLDNMSPGSMFTGFCFAIRVLEALGGAAFCTSSFTFVADVFPDNIGTIMGVLETFVGLGFSLGPALGGALYALDGYYLPFFVLGLCLIVSCPINVWLLPNSVRCDKSTQTGSILEMLKIPDVLAISSIIVVGSTVFGYLDPTLQPHLKHKFHMNPAQVGLVFLVVAATYAVVTPAWGWLADKTKKPWPIMLLGLLISALGLLLAGPSPLFPFLPNTAWSVILGLVICGLFEGASLIPTMGAMMDACESLMDNDTPLDSLVAGVWSCMFFLGQVIGPSLGGIVSDLYGFSFLSTAVCGATLVMIVLLLFYLGVRKFLHFSSHETSETSPLMHYSEDSKADDPSQEEITTYIGRTIGRCSDTGRGS